MKGTAVIEYTVNNYPHSSLVTSSHKISKKGITGFQILPVGTSNAIPCRISVFRIPLLQKLSAVLHNHPQMRIDMIVVLRIVFMIGGRDKQGIKI